MSKSYQRQSIHNKSFSVLPDIVANYKTTMCNPYDKRKIITDRSKIPVPKSTGLPAGTFAQPTKTGLANFRIPKLNRSLKNSTSSTSHSRNKTPSKPMTDKASRTPATYLPKVSQPTKRGPHTTTTTTTTNPKRKVIAVTSLTTNRAQRVQQRKGGPWPYSIPPCSRYTVKWGDPAYTGSYVEGEWCYDVVGAAHKPMGWPDMSEMFPGLPKGIFELRSVGQCAVPPELSSNEGKPDSHNGSQETSPVSDANNVLSRKPAQRHIVRHDTLLVTGPSVTMCAELQGREVSLVAPPRYTNVSTVTQTTTVCDLAKVTPYHSDRPSVHVNGDRLVNSVSKIRDIKRCDNGPYDRNLYKLFSSYPSTDVHKRGIKRSADDCVEPSFFKKIRTERQD